MQFSTIVAGLGSAATTGGATNAPRLYPVTYIYLDAQPGAEGARL